MTPLTVELTVELMADSDVGALADLSARLRRWTAGPGSQVRFGSDGQAGLLLSVGDPDPAVLDDWIRDSRPHLTVRLYDDKAIVGPFTEVGTDPCLRCLELHRGPTATRSPSSDWPPELAELAGAWALLDLRAYATGEIPATQSTEIVVPHTLRDIEARTWPRHPECGCWWNAPSAWLAS